MPFAQFHEDRKRWWFPAAGILAAAGVGDADAATLGFDNTCAGLTFTRKWTINAQIA